MIHYDYCKQSKMPETFGGLVGIGDGMHSYNEIYTALSLRARNFGAPINSHELAHATNEVYHHLAVRHSGEVIFTLAKEITEAFIRTDVTLPPEMVCFPYKNFIIQLPKDLKFTVTNFGDVVDIDTIYVGIDGDILRMMVATKVGANPKKGTTSYLKFTLKEGANLSEHMKEELGELAYDAETLGYDLSDEQKEESWLDVIDMDGWHNILNIILNLCLYLETSPHDRKVTKPKYRDLSKVTPKQSKKIHSPTTQYTYIGSKFIPRTNASAGGGSRTITKTFWVRGHWRLQRHGKGRQEIKKIFIQPFVKGSGELKQMRYKVG